MGVSRVAAILVFCLGLSAGCARAAMNGLAPGYPDSVEDYDAREVAMLPAYCKYTALFSAKVPGGNNVAEMNRWREELGDTFRALHHYCWGLMKTNRAHYLARTKQLKTFYLNSSVNEFDYVLQRAPADFVLLPEILTKKGENMLELGNRNGIAELERAIQIKPDYWPPYAALADFYERVKDRADAVDILEKGLAAAPGTKALQRRLTELKSGQALTSKSTQPMTSR